MPTVTSHSHASHQDSYVRARIDSQTKALATDALNAMGLSVSDAIRLLMLHIVEEKNLPFTLKVPNRTTRDAIAQLEAGKGQRFDDLDSLLDDLRAPD